MHSHDDYYEDNRNVFYKKKKTVKKISLFINDDFDSVLICDKKMNILHEINISKGGNFPELGYREV